MHTGKNMACTGMLFLCFYNYEYWWLVSDHCFTIRQISCIMGISMRTIERRLEEYNLSTHQQYSTVRDAELLEFVAPCWVAIRSWVSFIVMLSLNLVLNWHYTSCWLEKIHLLNHARNQLHKVCWLLRLDLHAEYIVCCSTTSIWPRSPFMILPLSPIKWSWVPSSGRPSMTHLSFTLPHTKQYRLERNWMLWGYLEV